MFGGVSVVRHLVVASSVVTCAGLAAVGAIGPSLPARFDQWQTVITPGATSESLNVSETTDIDFANHAYHGLYRTLPTGQSTPEQITATADGSQALVSNSSRRSSRLLEVKVGDPDVRVRGQHRYQLDYTYPDARLSTGKLSINVIGGGDDALDWDVAKLRATVTGFTLTDTECFSGPYRSTDRCTITQLAPGTYQVDLDNVPAGDAVTIRGTITDRVEPADVTLLPPPEVRPRPNRALATGVVAGTGVFVAGLLFFIMRFKGSNRVFAGGPADMAFGNAAFNNVSEPATTRVSDAQLADMATVEFVAPAGIAAWEGYLLMGESLDDQTLQAYISSLAGSGVIDIAQAGDNLVISAGENFADADAADQRHLRALFSYKNPFVTGEGDPRLSLWWRPVKADLGNRIAARRWWTSRLKHETSLSPRADRFLVLVVFVVGLFQWSGILAFILRWFGSALSASLATGAAVGVVAFLAYRVMLPSRTSDGSAAALRTASFKRFLHESEARHVQWAWEHGLLREYSGWAVALGEAAAWSAALQLANIAVPETITSPMRASGFGDSLVTPSRGSGAGGGGGWFGGGGGFAGGGGGGGGGGGW